MFFPERAQKCKPKKKQEPTRPDNTIPGAPPSDGQKPAYPIGQPPPNPGEPKPRPPPQTTPKPRPTYPPVAGWPAEHDYKVSIGQDDFVHI